MEVNKTLAKKKNRVSVNSQKKCQNKALKKSLFAKVLISLEQAREVQSFKIRQLADMSRCAGDAPSSFSFSDSVSSTLLSVYLSVSARSSIPPSLFWLPIQVTLSACVCECVRKECVCVKPEAPMSVYIVRRQLEGE